MKDAAREKLLLLPLLRVSPYKIIKDYTATKTVTIYVNRTSGESLFAGFQQNVDHLVKECSNF